MVRKVLGTLLAVACFGLALYALFRLVQGGSCASGGNYVSARPCPSGTGRWAAELPLGIIGGLLFLGLGFIKFGRAEPTPASTYPQPAPDQDPLARLERLRALRDANALTTAEYDEAKAKILSQM
jgi:hypothetical protein